MEPAKALSSKQESAAPAEPQTRKKISAQESHCIVGRCRSLEGDCDCHRHSATATIGVRTFKERGRRQHRCLVCNKDDTNETDTLLSWYHRPLVTLIRKAEARVHLTSVITFSHLVLDSSNMFCHGGMREG